VAVQRASGRYRSPGSATAATTCVRAGQLAREHGRAAPPVVERLGSTRPTKHSSTSTPYVPLRRSASFTAYTAPASPATRIVACSSDPDAGSQGLPRLLSNSSAPFGFATCYERSQDATRPGCAPSAPVPVGRINARASARGPVIELIVTNTGGRQGGAAQISRFFGVDCRSIDYPRTECRSHDARCSNQPLAPGSFRGGSHSRLVASRFRAVDRDGQGKVVDGQSQPVEGAKILIEFLDGVNRKYDVKTNKRGEYIQIVSSRKLRAHGVEGGRGSQAFDARVRLGAAAEVNFSSCLVRHDEQGGRREVRGVQKVFEAGVAASTSAATTRRSRGSRAETLVPECYAASSTLARLLPEEGLRQARSCTRPPPP